MNDRNFITDFADPIGNILNEELINIFYLDTSPKEQLNANDSVHIIAHQLELQFTNKKRLFVAWNFGGDSKVYYIACANQSFSNADEYQYEMLEEKHWKGFIKSKVEGWEIFCEVVIKEDIKSYRHPYLLKMDFNNHRSIYIANFQAEQSFIPKYTDGDDLWIIFDKTIAESFIKKFNLHGFPNRTLLDKD